MQDAGVAQSEEQLTRNEQVSGSNPLAGSIFLGSAPHIHIYFAMPTFYVCGGLTPFLFASVNDFVYPVRGRWDEAYINGAVYYV